jgi:hypothetical protein
VQTINIYVVRSVRLNLHRFSRTVAIILFSARLCRE